MQKLIEDFRELPNGFRRARLQGHINRHPMAVCMCTPEQIAFLKANGFKL